LGFEAEQRFAERSAADSEILAKLALDDVSARKKPAIYNTGSEGIPCIPAQGGALAPGGRIHLVYHIEVLYTKYQARNAFLLQVLIREAGSLNDKWRRGEANPVREALQREDYVLSPFRGLRQSGQCADSP